MIDLKKVIECENNFPKYFTNVCERPCIRLFYNRDNPLSYDSNHALILNLAYDLDKMMEDIISFYKDIRVIPRIYQSYQEGELSVLEPYFIKYGFQYQEYENSFLELKNKTQFEPSSGIIIKRAQSLDPGIIEMIYSENEDDWTVKVLERHLIMDHFHLLVGYVNNKPVTMASLNLMDGLSRVDDVMTHKEYRGKGCGRMLINYLVDYHSLISTNILYLYSSNPIAIKIYRGAGFVDFPQKLNTWSAWKEDKGF